MLATMSERTTETEIATAMSRKQLAGLELHHQDRHEDEHRGRGRDEHRAPDLPRAVVGGLQPPVAVLA